MPTSKTPVREQKPGIRDQTRQPGPPQRGQTGQHVSRAPPTRRHRRIVDTRKQTPERRKPEPCKLRRDHVPAPAEQDLMCSQRSRGSADNPPDRTEARTDTKSIPQSLRLHPLHLSNNRTACRGAKRPPAKASGVISTSQPSAMLSSPHRRAVPAQQLALHRQQLSLHRHPLSRLATPSTVAGQPARHRHALTAAR
jgi:hypothetical protein